MARTLTNADLVKARKEYDEDYDPEGHRLIEIDAELALRAGTREPDEVDRWMVQHANDSTTSYEQRIDYHDLRYAEEPVNSESSVGQKPVGRVSIKESDLAEIARTFEMLKGLVEKGKRVSLVFPH